MAFGIVTGHTGVEHITPSNMKALNAGICGSGQYVMSVGNKLSATLQTSNKVRIMDGYGMMEGCQFGMDAGEYADLTIENGAQGYNRIDLVVARYARNGTTGVESVQLVVIKGTASTGTASAPSYNKGSVMAGTTTDFPLYQVNLVGLTPSITALFSVLVPAKDAWDSVSQRISYEDVVLTAHIGSTGAEKNLNVLGPVLCNAENFICKRVVRVWATSSWANGAVVSTADEPAWNSINFTTNQEQDYEVVVRFYYWS